MESTLLVGDWMPAEELSSVSTFFFAPLLLSCIFCAIDSFLSPGEAAWRESGRRDATLGGEPGREARLQEAAAREHANNPMGRAVREGKFEVPEYRRPMDEGGGGGPARGRRVGGVGGGGGGGDGDEAYPDRNSDPVQPRGVATGDRGVSRLSPSIR